MTIESDADLAGQVSARVSRDAAYLTALDTTRHSLGPDEIRQISEGFYMVLASGFVGAVLQEVVKGMLGDAGKALGEKIRSVLPRWSNAAKGEAALGEARTLITEAKQILTPAQLNAALDAGNAALEQRLIAEAFPASKARALAADITAIARP